MNRVTKIVCTLGPVSANYPGIRDMALLGMDVARMNFSHSTHSEHLHRLRTVRQASKSIGRRIAVLQDLPGPKIRVGTIVDEPMHLRAGKKVTVRCGAETSVKDQIIPVPFEGLADAVEEGRYIFLADGAITLKVLGIDGKDIKCLIETGGYLKTHKGVNIPETTRRVPAVTPEDENHMRFGAKNGVDYIAVSFVRTKEDITQARKILEELDADIPIVAKMEKQEAIRNHREIIRAADVVMVARGDLGVEIGLQNVPLAQKMIIAEANRQRKPVITATQMLLSMVNEKSPTRAEVSDVANAILDGTNAVMLSEETAAGHHCREAVKWMDRIARTIEKDRSYMGMKVRPWKV